MAGFGLSTLLTVIFIGGITFIIAWRRPFPVLAALVLLVPFRDLSIRWMNASTRFSPDWVNAISRWWFIVILALLALVAIKWIIAWAHERKPIRIDKVDLTLGLVILIAVFHTVISPNLSAGFTSLRGYLQPLAVFFIARRIKPTRQQLQTLIYLLLIVGFIMAIFEVIQVASWTAEDYRANGYLRQNGELVTPTIVVRGQDYIRPTATVSGPNELGVDMMILSFLAVFSALQSTGASRWLFVTAAFAFIVGNLLSFSRSALLGTFAAVVVIFLLMARMYLDTRRTYRLELSKRSLLAILTGAVLTLSALYFLGVIQHLIRTVSHLSTQYHFVDSRDALQFLVKNPAGVGMGLVEPKGALALIETPARYHVEGSLFQIALEMGVWGLFSWLLFWGVCLSTLWRSWSSRQSPEIKILIGTTLASWVGALIAFLFLPLMQSISLMVWLWFLLGLAVDANAIEGSWEAAGVG